MNVSRIIVSGERVDNIIPISIIFPCRFLRKSQLAMPEDLKLQVKQSLKDGANIEKNIFDKMEQEVRWHTFELGE